MFISNTLSVLITEQNTYFKLLFGVQCIFWEFSVSNLVTWITLKIWIQTVISSYKQYLYVLHSYVLSAGLIKDDTYDTIYIWTYTEDH